MSVFVNYKICDNAVECSGIDVCPTGALYWDENKESLLTDNAKCISCDICVDACPAGAIFVAHNAIEANEIEQSIASDPRTREMLMVERYGASPVNESIFISVDEAIKKVMEDSSLLAIEVIDEEDTPCLINSVPIVDLLSKDKYFYFKVSIHDEAYETFSRQYVIEDCPALLIFYDHKLLKLVQGTVDNNDRNQRNALIGEIRSVL